MNLFPKLSLLTLLVISACKNIAEHRSEGDVHMQNTIGRVKLTDLNSQPIDMKRYTSKTVVINFWATWCKPCLEEMPSIQKAKEMLKDQHIEFLFASDESTEQIETFKAEHDYGFNYFKAANMEELNIMGLPTTLIFGRDGKLVFSEIGYRKWDNKTNIDLIQKIAKRK